MTCTDLSHLKKYASRNSPPFPANQCKGQRKRGNDGTFYTSVSASNGVYRWQKSVAAKKSPKKTAKKAAKKSPKKKTAKKTAKKSPKKTAKKTAKKGNAPIVDVTGMSNDDVLKAYKRLCRWAERKSRINQDCESIDLFKRSVKAKYRELARQALAGAY